MVEKRAHSGARVLVIDDDATVRSFLMRGLARDGLDAVEAANGDAGLAAFDARTPQLVLLDVQMPGTSGFDVCRAIRRRPGGAELPIVMMTGMDDMGAIEQAYEAGATDFVTKPLPWLILSHRLRYLLRAADTLRELRASEERLATSQSLASIGSWELDLDGSFRGSPVLWEILGLDETTEAPTLAMLGERVHPDDRETLREAVRHCRESGRPTRCNHRVIRPDGAERVLHCQVHMATAVDGSPTRMVGVSQDLTERKRTEEQVRFLSSHDPLTSLGNRRLFRERLDLALRQARRGGWKVGVVYLDLDHFKRINETFSHSVGDALLSEVADRLVMSVRAADLVVRSDPGFDPDTGRRLSTQESAVSRFGGDEFTILIPRLRDEQDLAAVGRRLLEALSQPFSVEGHEVVVGSSIGLTVFPSDGDSPEELLRNADTAMYAAKKGGRNRYQFYTQSMNERSLRRLILESKLRRALDESQLELHYQPKVSLASGRPTGFEGLLRWQDPELGLVGPGDFIPVAEETGLIEPIGDWVLGQACRQLAGWAAEGCDVSLAINLSPEQFRRPGIARRVAEVARAAGANLSRLEVEITETAVLHDTEVVIRELRAIRELGVRVALDDFGTGYSSLSYLRRLPVDTLKIDRSFIHDIESDPEDAGLTQGIIAMGKALGLRLVAEGVETAGQRARLTEWGCDEMQGFLFSPAVPSAQARQLLELDGD